MEEVREKTGVISSEDRVLAGLSHVAVIGNMVGIVVGTVVWLTRREKNPFAAFQGLQAAVYQIIVFALTICCWMCWLFFYLLTLIPATRQPKPGALFWIGMFSMFLPFIFMGLLWVYGIVGGVIAFMGKDFRYVLIGRWLEKYLEEKEEPSPSADTKAAAGEPAKEAPADE